MFIQHRVVATLMTDMRKMGWNLKRLSLACGISAAVCLLVGFQSLSAIVARHDPEIAVNLGGNLGHAYERLAYSNFRDKAQNASLIREAANASQELALKSFIDEPLVPQAWALFAFAQSDAESRDAILGPALSLNRREVLLQSAALSHGLVGEDFPATVTAIDAILRVRPKRSQELFPLLVQALEQPEAASEFSTILDFSAPWHERFLLTAVGSENARINLAGLRGQLDFDNERFDRSLISGLAAQGEMTLARDVYESVVARRRDANTDGSAANWVDTFPPFDWALTSSPELRAQKNLKEDALDLFIRSGNGGVVASKLIDWLQKPLSIKVVVSSQMPLREGNLTLTITCLSGNEELLVQDLAAGINEFTVQTAGRECEDPIASLRARSFRGDPDLRASVKRFSTTNT